jgi:hypothetical protein
MFDGPWAVGGAGVRIVNGLRHFIPGFVNLLGKK